MPWGWHEINSRFLKFQEKKGQEAPKGPEYEIPKLDKILALVRDPDEIKRRKDEETATAK